MKRRLFALMGAIVLTLSMSMTAMAAPSPTATAVAIATTASGQVITQETVKNFVATTKMVSTVPDAKIQAVSNSQAQTLTAAASSVVGSNATVATMVDIVVPAGTGAATFTLAIPTIVAGQSVSVLHLKSDGTIEALPVSSVDNGSVTFAMTSYSPVAVVVNATAPKTGETSGVYMLVIAGIAMAAAMVCARRLARN